MARIIQAACALILVAGCASQPGVGHSGPGPMNFASMSDTEQKIFASAGCAYFLSNAAELATGQRERQLFNARSKILLENLMDLGVTSLREPLVEMGIRLTMETLNHVDSIVYLRWSNSLSRFISRFLTRTTSAPSADYRDQDVASADF